MARAQLILHTSPSEQRKGGQFPVVLRVTHKGRRKYFSTGIACDLKNWDEINQRVKGRTKSVLESNETIESIQVRALEVLQRIRYSGQGFSFTLFEKYFKNDDSDLYDAFCKAREEECEAQGRLSTAAQYRTGRNHLMRMFKQKHGLKSPASTVKLNDITPEVLTDYLNYLRTKTRPCSDNAISNYMRGIRSILNKAMLVGKCTLNRSPFHHFKLSSHLKKSARRIAISRDKMRQIEHLDLNSSGHKTRLARDIFILSYYLRGINFADLCEIKPEHIIEDKLYYRRNKTGAQFSIQILPQAKMILDRYAHQMIDPNDYILPIYNIHIHKSAKSKFNRKKAMLRDINDQLKHLAERIDLKGVSLSSYCARHTYANVLNQNDVPISDIQKAMGHSSEKVTREYLNQLENPRLHEFEKAIL